MSWDKFYQQLEDARNLFKNKFEAYTGLSCPRLYTTRMGSDGTVTLPLNQDQVTDQLWDQLSAFETDVVKSTDLYMGWNLYKKNGDVVKRPKVWLKN